MKKKQKDSAPSSTASSCGLSINYTGVWVLLLYIQAGIWAPS